MDLGQYQRQEPASINGRSMRIIYVSPGTPDRKTAEILEPSIEATRLVDVCPGRRSLGAPSLNSGSCGVQCGKSEYVW